MNKHHPVPTWLLRLVVAGYAAFFTFGIGSLSDAAQPTPPQVSISNVPMTLVTPAHPQVLLAVTNSQSMDGDLSGAIMTGSGASNIPSQLNGSSSPVNYTVPSGFTPPCNPTITNGQAPYTVSVSGTLCDNSASRLNVAKASIQSILQTYSGTTDFGLMDYDTSGTSLFATWVYYMSPSAGFTFTNTAPAAPTRYVNNPCYNNGGLGLGCAALTNLYGNAVLTDQYMIISASSDDPDINDVLYAGGLSNVFVIYGGPNPASQFNYTLAQYNAGHVNLCYSNSTPNQGGSFCETPTNAGYVPATPQVLQALRGFGYGGSQSRNSGMLLVPVTSAGQNPTQTQINNYVAQFTPYLAPETNVPNNGEIQAVAGQSPIAGILTQALSYYTSGGGPTSSNGCTPLRFVVLMTDGLPTEDLSGKNWPPLGSASAAGYGVSATFDPVTGALSTTNDQALTDTIAELAALKTAKVLTFIIGMGAGVNPANNPQAAATLRAMAVAGGTGNYFPATSPAAVTSQLQVILSTIQGMNLATSSAAVNSTGLNAGSTVYQAQFTSNDTPYSDWTGNLFAYPIIASGTNAGTVNTASPTWSAQSLLDAKTQGSGWDTNRVITTWNPLTLSGVPFRWNNISATQQLELQTSPTDTLGPARLDYLRGDPCDTQNPPTSCGTPAGPFRNRSHTLGDIVDSNPIYVSASNGPYTADPTYVSYEQTTLGRQPMLYVGANDGMLHAFNATTGQEQFAFIPNGAFPNLIKLTQPTYNAQHQFYVDGSPTAGDVQFANNSWHTILVGGLNDGGNSIYALDITNPSTLTNETAVASSVLWEYTDFLMGQTYSRPFIAQTNDTTDAPDGFMVFFGSGYNNSDGNPYLYAVNAQTGALVQRINLCASVNPNPCNSSLPNGLSSPVAVNGGGGLGVPATTVYAGDLQGNLWKVDISSALPAQWTVSLLFQARDASGNPQPITTTPSVSLNPNYPQLSGPIVFFGTGQFLGAPDITNTNVQSFYAIWDNGSTTRPTRSNNTLVQQTLTDQFVTQSGQTTEVRTISNNPVDYSSGKRGWFIDLGSAVSPQDTGERVITDPRLENGRVVFTTYVPSTNACQAGGGAFLMVVNYVNGGSFPKPELDINGDGVINSSDQVNGQNPVGLGLGNVYATAPTIISASLGNVRAVKLVTEAGTAGSIIKSVKERGGGTRTSWRQIQN